MATLLELPYELLLAICTAEVLTARDLVALELSCSSFRQGEPGSGLAELAAKTRLRRAGARLPERAQGEGEAAGVTRGNFKHLMRLVLEDVPLPTFICPRCRWQVGGFRCCGRRPAQPARQWVSTHVDLENYETTYLASMMTAPDVPVPSGCGTFLQWDPALEQLVCVVGCGSIDPPACICKSIERDEEKRKAIGEDEPLFEVMTVSLGALRSSSMAVFYGSKPPPPWDLTEEQMVKYDMYSRWDAHRPIHKKSPLMTCTRCGLTVDGYACLGRENHDHHPPGTGLRQMLQVGFYERVWCSYAWRCHDLGCALIRDGSVDPDDTFLRTVRSRAFLCCTARSECRNNPHPEMRGTEMAALEWLDEKGPANNSDSLYVVLPK